MRHQEGGFNIKETGMKNQAKAFTLLELLIVLALLAIASTIMLPAMGGLLDRAQLDSQKDTLVSHVQTARSHAVKYAILTDMCGSSDGMHCDGQWQSGWLVRERAPARILLRHELDAAKLDWRGFSPEIVFHPNGTTPSSNGRFSICSDKSTPGWELILNRQGRLRAEKGSPQSQNGNC